MEQMEQTLDSLEVAEMVEKAHNELLKDIRRYCKQLGEGKIPQSVFFTESTYRNSQNKEFPCYRITKKGCEFIAHKLTGTKGTIFTARYINRFHEMQNILSAQESEPELPWYIRRFRGRYIILERDFIQITGVDIRAHKKFYGQEYFEPGCDWGGWGWYDVTDKEQFKREYGFEYGEDKMLTHFYLCGAMKALKLLLEEKAITDGKYEAITKEIKQIGKQRTKELSGHKPLIEQTEKHKPSELLIQIQIFGR